MLSIQPESNMATIMAAQDARQNKQPFARVHRVTRENRHLWYQLEVLQQPERARACGSGPKSSADRRPVDPPPVVILRVLEGENYDGARDVTFDYNVDFFCYASLEHARPMAHGRVQTPAATSPPVLTGFPVSGCCYLDRPDPAGYFLFPDLSVRHEGRYRLVFSLYELIKEDRDKDLESPQQDQEDTAMAGSTAGDAMHRMDLKSEPFLVYSAKKFPGLTESTSLSRTVAEQGCRVRIRRDVRMRRRDTKASAASEYETNPEEEYARRHRTQTPEGYRARSVSNSSMDRAAYVPDHQRRPSNADYPGAPPQSMYQSSQPSNGVLNFGHGGHPTFAQPFGPAPTSSHHPQSTPVSPAQPIFPQNAHFPPPSPSYQTPPSYSQYESQPELKRRSSSGFPPISAKPPPPIAPYARPSVSGYSNMMPTLPAMIPPPSPKRSPSSHLDRLGPLSASSRPSQYPPIESRGMKRSADESLAFKDARIVRGARQQLHEASDVEVARYARAGGGTDEKRFPDYF